MSAPSESIGRGPRPIEPEQSLERWVEGEIFRILRSCLVGKVSVHEIILTLVPGSNTVADHEFRTRYPRWGLLKQPIREQMILDVVEELIALHRITTTGTEKYSRYRNVVEIEVLDSLSRV